MSEQNLDVVRRAHQAFNRRDVDAFLEDADPNLVWDWSRAVGPDREILRGRDGVVRFIRSWWDAFDESVVVVDELIDVEDHVVLVFHGRQRGRASGAEVEGPGSVLVWTFQGGKAVRMTLYQTRAEALAAVGRSE
jgi:ketosteroid isomerase-like protein